MPLLLGFRHKGVVAGAVGVKPGLYRPMFLEQYLDSPVEQQVAAFSMRPVDRHSLVEIGNLAVARQGYGSLIMTIMVVTLAEAGYEWMVFTVTEQVERLMRRLGFEPHYLVRAEPGRLLGNKLIWGSYYENKPCVMVGSIKAALEAIAQSSALSELVARRHSYIVEMACLLKDYRRLREE